MKKYLKITPEWVLENLALDVWVENDPKKVFVSAPNNDFYWVKLALETLGIEWGLMYDGNDCSISIWEFPLEKLRYQCPNIFKRLDKNEIRKAKIKQLKLKKP